MSMGVPPRLVWEYLLDPYLIRGSALRAARRLLALLCLDLVPAGLVDQSTEPGLGTRQ